MFVATFQNILGWFFQIGGCNSNLVSLIKDIVNFKSDFEVLIQQKCLGLNHDGGLASYEMASHHLWEENLGNRSLRTSS